MSQFPASSDALRARGSSCGPLVLVLVLLALSACAALAALPNPARATNGDIFLAGSSYSYASYTRHFNYFLNGYGADPWTIDMHAKDGQGDLNHPLYAPEAGTVVSLPYNWYGNHILWKSADGSEELHMAHLSQVVKTGVVKGGDLIARMGGTPNYPPHLHIERRLNGKIAPLVLSGRTLIDEPPFVYDAPNYSQGDGPQVVSTGPIYSVPYRSPWQVKTIAGQPGATGKTDGTGTTARFNYPEGIVRRADGFLYVSDTHSSTIRKVSTAGAVTTYAGQAGHDGSFDVDVTMALFRQPEGITCDRSGNLYIADSDNHTIRKITPTGWVTTIAGLPGHSGYADGQGSGALFNYPEGIACDAAGNLYVADRGNHVVRKVSSSGQVTTLAGKARQPGSANGAALAAQFNQPEGIAVDSAGNIYVTDYNNCTIRKIAGGQVTTLAGTAGQRGSTDGAGQAARFGSAEGITCAPDGTLFVADTSNNTIRKIDTAGNVTTIAGQAGKSGWADGVGTATLFRHPESIVWVSSTLLYVADSQNHVIRELRLPQ